MTVVGSGAATANQAHDEEKAAMALKLKEMEDKVHLLEAEEITRAATAALRLTELEEHNERLSQETDTLKHEIEAKHALVSELEAFKEEAGVKDA